MRDSAAAAFYPECLILEASRGPINWMYPDSKDLPTTGIGSLLGTKAALNDAALDMPWRWLNRHWATRAQKQAEWERLRDANIKGDGYAYEKSALLFLDQADVQIDFNDRAGVKEKALKRFLPNWSNLRADAQLAAMSMAWNAGEHIFDPESPKYWQSLTVPLKAGDYVGASDHCLINGETSERNRRDRRYFLQAARGKVLGTDPDTLAGAVVKVSAASIINGNPTKPGSHAFWAQVLLREAGTYKSALDGLFGPVSLAAWKKATGEATPAKAGLLKLCDQSRWTLGIEGGA